MSSDPDKRALAGLFSTTSAIHDSVGGLFAHFGELLVERAALGPGDRVRDEAAGAGASLIPAARRVGSAYATSPRAFARTTSERRVTADTHPRGSV